MAEAPVKVFGHPALRVSDGAWVVNGERLHLHLLARHPTRLQQELSYAYAKRRKERLLDDLFASCQRYFKDLGIQGGVPWGEFSEQALALADRAKQHALAERKENRGP